jgi:hypothetical protein
VVAPLCVFLFPNSFLLPFFNVFSYGVSRPDALRLRLISRLFFALRLIPPLPAHSFLSILSLHLGFHPVLTNPSIAQPSPLPRRLLGATLILAPGLQNAIAKGAAKSAYGRCALRFSLPPSSPSFVFSSFSFVSFHLVFFVVFVIYRRDHCRRPTRGYD